MAEKTSLRNLEGIDIENEVQFAQWIADFVSNFLFKCKIYAKKRNLQHDDNLDAYYGIINLRDRTELHYDDSVDIQIEDEKCTVRLDKPLHPLIHNEPGWAFALTDNLRKIALYGINRMEDELLQELKEVTTGALYIVDRYILFPKMVKITLLSNLKTGDAFWSYVFSADIEFDLVDEEQYVPPQEDDHNTSNGGGTKYQEAKTRFDLERGKGRD